MDRISRLINRMSDLREFGINKVSKEERAYILLTTNLAMFQGVVKEYGNESSFAMAYGIPNLIYSINNDLVRIYIPKEAFSVDLRQLMKDLDANVVEYYGVVQFDGTEPEARGEYIFDPVIQMSDKVINDFKGNTKEKADNTDNEEEEEEDNNSDTETDNRKEDSKPKRKLYKLVKKENIPDDKEEDKEETDEEIPEDDSNEEEGDNNGEEIDNIEDEGDNDWDDKEEDDEEVEVEDDSDSEEDPSIDKNSRAYFMKGVKNPNDEEEGISDEDNSENEEDPDSVDQFFDDEEVEANLDKKSDEIEKDLSRELDKRIEDEKAKKKEVKEKSKRFKKLKKKEPTKESIEASSIPSSRVANMDLLKSLASEPIEYSNFGFNDFNKIERIIKRAMMTKDDYKRIKKKNKFKLVY